MLLNNQGAKKQSKEKSKKVLKQIKIEMQCTKICGMQQKQILEERTWRKNMPALRKKKDFK